MCRYPLADPLPPRCSECGWAVELCRLVDVRVVPVAKFTAPVILAGVLGGPLLFAALGAVLSLGGPSSPVAALFPYAFVLLQALPSDAAILGVMAGLFQGPAYGFILGLALPIARHRAVWTVVLALHAVCAAIALWI